MAKYCYKLLSCDPTQYQDITNLCLETILGDIDKTVYINGDASKLYRIVFVGEDVCICEKTMPPYTVVAKECKQPSPLRAFIIQNCETGEERQVYLAGETTIVGAVIEVNEALGCWTITRLVELAKEIYTIKKVFRDCKTCLARNYYLLVNCKSGEKVEAEITGNITIGNVITVVQNKECWEVKGVAKQGVQWTLLAIYKDCVECSKVGGKYWELKNCATQEVITAEIQGGLETWTYTGHLKTCDDCSQPSGDCTEDGERTIAYAVMVRLPEPPIPDKGFKECCYVNLVLAHPTDSDKYKNDFTGFWFKKQTATDDCNFILHELNTGDTYDLNNGTYGVFKDFGSIVGQPNLTTFIVHWRKVLNLLGTGTYQIEKETTVAGLSFSEMSNTFTLEKFNDVVADKTIRIDAKMDGKLVHFNNVNFKGSDFETSIRTYGFFGRREPKYKQDNLVKRNYNTVQISMSQENEYELQTGLIPECITEQVYDFLLFGNELFISDYNLINHSYKYRLYEVEFDSNKGGKYYTTNRDARLNLTFADRIKNKRKINC